MAHFTDGKIEAEEAKPSITFQTLPTVPRQTGNNLTLNSTGTWVRVQGHCGTAGTASQSGRQEGSQKNRQRVAWMGGTKDTLNAGQPHG